MAKRKIKKEYQHPDHDFGSALEEGYYLLSQGDDSYPSQRRERQTPEASAIHRTNLTKREFYDFLNRNRNF